MKTENITISINYNNVAEKTEIVKFLRVVAALEKDDRERINELVSEPKALSKLKDNWNLLKKFV